MANNQHALFDGSDFDTKLDLTSKYFVKHLITYIGNKRKLLPFINVGINHVKHQLGKKEITSLDGFAGSGVVSRLLKHHSSRLVSNDFEDYTETINRAYLANRSSVDIPLLESAIRYLNGKKLEPTASDYFIAKNYAPKDDQAIRPGERVFYTNSNARIIDNIRYLIGHDIDPAVARFCLANLLIEASIHNNTSGVFKGFHKKDGIGHFGGQGENALRRITGEITLEMPVFSQKEAEVIVTKRDTNELVKELDEVDLAYYDPPYNQHPYGSNYFMLNIINDGKPVPIQQGVSGITADWQRSDYNKIKPAELAMDDLLGNTKAKYILISYNNEGIIPFENFKRIASKHGQWNIYEQEYNTYRGSRNLGARDLRVKELLWLIKKH
jgi:adenine-specific DNA-methyltransferase